jgi:hypothetical protein
VERTPDARTVFRIVLPGRLLDALRSAEALVSVPSLVPAKRDDASDNSIPHPDR